jgi:Na+/melibiose symporter-like transporter
MTTVAAGQRLRLPTVLGYAAGSLGMGVYSTVPGVLLLYYMTQILALPPALAALAVLAPKLVILVVEPLVGAASDRVGTRWGRRRPFLIVGAGLSAITFALLFNTPKLADQWATFGEIALAYLVASVAFSVFAVPYVAMPAELSDDPGQRARIVGIRMIFVYLGVLTGSAAPPLLVDRLGAGDAGYGRMAIAIAAVSLVSMLVSGAATPDRARGKPAERRPRDRRPRDRAASLLGFAPFVLAVGVYVLIMTGSGALSAAAPYFVTYVLDAPQTELALVFTTKVVAALGAMALWTWLTQRLGFTRTLVVSLVLSAAGALALLGAHAGQHVGDHLPAFILIGAGSAGVQVAAFALLADVTARFARVRGVSSAGAMTGLWTASEKLALALGPALTGGLLAVSGFRSAAPMSAEPTSALDGARFAISLAPAAVFALAAAALLLTRKALDNDTDLGRIDTTQPLQPERAIG